MSNKLQRDIARLSSETFDLCVIGAGIFGACAAWDAALRGAKVALIEKNDFASATSAHHFKMVHGGIRYLQHGDIQRIKESCRERSALLRIAPHLVAPLSILIPTFGHGKKGKAFLRLGMAIYDTLTLGCNKNILQERRIPRHASHSRSETIRKFPALSSSPGLTGSVSFCDGQIYNPPRLALSFLRSAADRGVTMANYLEAASFIKEGKAITGVIARDNISGDNITIQARHFLNTSGPWAHRVLEKSLGITITPRPHFSRDLAFVVNRPFPSRHALACFTKSADSDALVDRGGRHLFPVPWRQYTLVGVWHKIFKAPPEQITAPPDEIQSFIDEINQAYPAANITLQDVSRINTGLTLFGDEADQQEGKMSFGKRSLLVDHRKEHGVTGLTTVIGVRATTARGLAERAITHIGRQAQIAAESTCRTETTPIYGGDISSMDDLLREIKNSCPDINRETAIALLRNYGSAYEAVLAYGRGKRHLLQPFKSSTVLRAEIIHGIREEMAISLADLVLRRTDLATGACPADEVLRECAEIAGAELQWDAKRITREINSVKRLFPHTSWHTQGHLETIECVY